jgi:hypothetical protein
MLAVAVPGPPAERLFDPSDVPDPHGPSKKLTLPLGVSSVLVTVAVRETVLPNVDGFGVLPSDRLVEISPPTFWVIEPLLPMKPDVLGM